MSKHAMHLYINEDQYQKMRFTARDKGVPIAAQIRLGIEMYLAKVKDDPDLVGVRFNEEDME